jgi:FAD/FMN-containing dehydrogenase
MTKYSDRINILRAALPELDWSVAPLHIKRMSRDFHWFSPVLKRQLDGKAADATVCPRNEDELRQVVAACAGAGVPLTMRGGGTGNYGQAVPLEGGVVVDMTACNELVWVSNGVVRAQAGIKLAALDELLAPHGWELRCMPSTFRMATLGGLFCGGFGGVGSITYGPLAAPGTVLGVKVMTVEAEPRVLELRSPEAMRLAHTYGTNGIILELDIAVAPALAWNEYLLGFPDATSAFSCAQALAQAPGIPKKNVALFANSVVRYFSKLTSRLNEGEHAVIAAITASSHEALESLVATHGGAIAWYQGAAEAKTSQHTLLEYCWNHTTLHALRDDKAITYLQTAYEYGQEREQLAIIEQQAGGEVLNHLEFVRDMQGRVTCVGLPLIRFTTEDRLGELIALHRQHGIKINDPHVYTLEDGKHGGALDPEILAAKHRYDPTGLLNPGKIRSKP